MIRRAPLKTDPPGKCSRWWVKIYNAALHKHEMHTVRGTRKDAEAYEREQKDKLGNGTFIARKDKKTVQEVYDLWLDELGVRGRAASTLAEYTSSLSLYVLPDFGAKEVGAVRKDDVRAHFNKLRKRKPAATVNKALRAFKALLNYALDLQLIDPNPLTRFKPYERADGEPTVNRDAFTEAEVRAILAAARPHERALIGLLCFTGVRPGEVYALDWAAVDLDAGHLTVRRNWCHRSGTFRKPKTKAGTRLVPLAPWVIEALRVHRGDAPEAALVFPSREGTPFNPSNVRRDVWVPLKERAKVRNLDLYSLRHTFVTHSRASGAEAFNVARAIGHAKSTIVDGVYANHTLDSGVAPLSAMVTDRILGTATPPTPPGEGSTRNIRPRLRVVK